MRIFALIRGIQGRERSLKMSNKNNVFSHKIILIGRRRGLPATERV